MQECVFLYCSLVGRNNVKSTYFVLKYKAILINSRKNLYLAQKMVDFTKKSAEFHGRKTVDFGRKVDRGRSI